MTALGRILLVRVGAERVALPLAAVRELVDAPTLLPVPMAPAAVRGQLSLRGQHIPVLALAALLEIPSGSVAASASAAELPTAGVALVMADEGYALAVDDVVDVLDPGDQSLRPVPAGADRQGTIRALLHLGAEIAALADETALTRVAVATLRTESPV